MRVGCLAAVALLLGLAVEGRRDHYVRWTKDNPMFGPDNADHIVDVNVGNEPWEHDQVDIECPTTSKGERHVVYSVSRKEFDSCRITDPDAKVVAVCDAGGRCPPMHFTITFRPFSPTPGGLEFLPGRDYHFISTSDRKAGGWCATHNVKMMFRVAATKSGKLRYRKDLQPTASGTGRTASAHVLTIASVLLAGAFA